MALTSEEKTQSVIVKHRTRLITIDTASGVIPVVVFHRERNEIIGGLVVRHENDPSVTRLYSDIVNECHICADGTLLTSAHVAEFLKVKGDAFALQDNPALVD